MVSLSSSPVSRYPNKMSNVVGTVYNRWARQIMYLVNGRKVRRTTGCTVGKKVEKVMKQRNVTSDDPVNRQLWRLKIGDWRTGRKLTDRRISDGWVGGWIYV